MLRTWPAAQRGKYLYIPPIDVNVISVFDELRYDRADADMVAPAMRKHVVTKLGELGFKQVSGNVIEKDDIRCLFPKSHALGASPFDIIRYTPKRDQDYYVLTPTQTACQIIDGYDIEQAVARIADLIALQPINIYRIKDFLEDKPSHQQFLQAIPHLRYLQRKALESDRLKSFRALRI